MTHARRTAVALLCLMLMALMLLQDAQARKLLWTSTAEDKQSHGAAGSRVTDTTSPIPEPCKGRGGGSPGGADRQDQQQQVQGDDTSKWAELHTDYIYTQDVKHNP